MKRMTGLTHAAVVGLALLIACSCRSTPKLRTDMNNMLPAPRTADYRTVPPIEVEPAAMEPGWANIDTPLAGGGGGAIVPTSERWAAVVLYFAYDSAVIGEAERPKLETLAEHLSQHPNYSVVIEGHCDERGSDEYNRALGEARALVVRDYLESLGIDRARMETISYGEERPVVPNADSEAGHRKNRRAEFIIGVRQ